MKDKVQESTELVTTQEPLTPEVIMALPDSVKEQYVAQLAERYGLKLNFERSESRTTHEEVAPQVITVLTDLDSPDPDNERESITKLDKWGFWKDYHGTKGKIFDTEVPQIQFGHLGAIMPLMRKNVYKYTYDIDTKTGLVKTKGGKPIILKKERVHLIVELSNLKARNNLAEGGYARGQQERVIIGGIGQVSPMSEGSMDKAMELMFGKRGK